MKHIENIIALAAVATIAGGCAAHAQSTNSITTNNVVTLTVGATNAVTVNSIPNFFNQVAVWATSLDTNKSWAGVTFQFEDGLNQSTGVGAADYIRGQYDLGRWNLAAEGDFFGVGSAFNSGEAGAGFALVEKFDFKAEINALIGGTKISSTSDTMKFKAEPELKITKLMTAGTYATVGLSVPWVQGQKFEGTPAFRAGMGFTF